MVDRPSTESSPRTLIREAVALALILGVSLVLSAVDSHALTQWQGYPSSLLLLALTWWYKRRLGRAVRFSQHRDGLFSVIIPVAMVLLLLLCANWTLSPRGAGTVGWPRAVHLLLLVPLSEEFFFRGVLLDHLRRGFSDAGAVVLCSLLFTLLHLPTGGAPGAALLSLLACLLVLRTGGWAAAFQLHVAYNGFSQIARVEDPSLRWGMAIFASVLIAAISLVSWKKPKEQRAVDSPD